MVGPARKLGSYAEIESKEEQARGSETHVVPLHHFHLTQSVSKVVLQKHIPTQIRQLILYVSDSKDHGFLGQLTSTKRQ